MSFDSKSFYNSLLDPGKITLFYSKLFNYYNLINKFPDQFK